MHPEPIYQALTILDRDLHRELRLARAATLEFARGTTLVPVVVGEFVELARQCPIAFLKDADGGWRPVALLGLPGGGNVYLDADGRWTAPYLPAYLRRYPFVFAATGPDQRTLCIDRACALVGAEGERLFTPEGEPAPLTQQALALLAEFERQDALTRAFTATLVAANLLTEVRADARLDDGRSLALGGLAVIDEAALQALPDATLAGWVRGGEMTLIHAQRASLGTLLELLRRAPALTADGASSHPDAPPDVAPPPVRRRRPRHPAASP